jgi:hypothetical protein
MTVNADRVFGFQGYSWIRAICKGIVNRIAFQYQTWFLDSHLALAASAVEIAQIQAPNPLGAWPEKYPVKMAMSAVSKRVPAK